MAKPTKNLVPVGTHIPATLKLGLQALAEAQDKTIYILLQEMIEEKVSQFEFDINALKKGESVKEPLEDDLLGSTADDSDLLA